MSESAAHEARCRRCAACCRRKVAVEGVVFWLPFLCRFLDRATKLCKVYEKRHEASPSCLSVQDAAAKGGLPADCAYVQGIEGYRGPIEGFDFWNLPEATQRDWAARIGVTASEFEEARAAHYNAQPAPAGA